MNFQEAETYLLSLGNEVSTMKLGLENIRTLLNALEDPQKKYVKVQVAGTNGKGSVCAFLNSICVSAGIRTGMFTSPHLMSITERVKIGGVDISEEDFARHASRVRSVSEELVANGSIENIPTFFEQVTAIALLAFATANVDLAILETGLGGRLDATTAADADIAAITRIDLDHQQYLGETIEEIAAEKAAIIRPDSRVCIGRQHTAALAVIKRRCADVEILPRTLENAQWARYALGYDFQLESFSVREVEIPLSGEHQVENAALAILVAWELKRFFWIRKTDIRTGIENTRHPGRLEYLKLPRVQVFLDGAHNPGGARALAAYLKNDDPEATSAALLFAAMDDKNVSEMLGALAPVVNDIILTEAANTRSMPAEKIAEAVRDQIGSDRIAIVPDVPEALKTAIETAGAYKGVRWQIVVVTGSLHLVGEVRRILGEFLPTTDN